MYDSMVNQVDQSLIPLFKKINEKKYLKNTVTIIMSDHGESFGEYGTLGHDSNHHTDLYYTPLIINLPNVSPKIITSTTGNIDIFPTILESVGINLSLDLQGKSLLSNINSQSDNNDRYIYSENLEGLVLINQNWLFYLPNVATSSNQSFLYNKITDPDEKINVAKRYPELTKLLYEQVNILRSYDESLQKREAPIDFNILKIDPEKLERLKKEGYF
jgi:arylsulfatase A-like enzyme